MQMPIPEDILEAAKAALKDLCDRRVPRRVFDSVRLCYKVRGYSITLSEKRKAIRKADVWLQGPVAQFRYDPRSEAWTLFYADRNSRWQPYLDIDPSEDVEVLLREVEEDPTGIFWG